MIVAADLLALNFFGIILLFARLAGWSVDRSLYTVWAIGLIYLGSATLVLQLIRFLVRPTTTIIADSPRILDLRVRIRDSIRQSAAWLSIATAVLIVGVERILGGGRPRLAILGTAGFVCFSLLLIRQFRRHTRWRSICLRRKG